MENVKRRYLLWKLLCLVGMQDVHCPAQQRKVMRSADGENGFSMEVGPYVSFANRNGVSAVFSGEVSSWPGVDMVQITHDGALPALRNINPAWPSTF